MRKQATELLLNDNNVKSLLNPRQTACKPSFTMQTGIHIILRHINCAIRNHHEWNNHGTDWDLGHTDNSDRRSLMFPSGIRGSISHECKHLGYSAVARTALSVSLKVRRAKGPSLVSEHGRGSRQSVPSRQKRGSIGTVSIGGTDRVLKRCRPKTGLNKERPFCNCLQTSIGATASEPDGVR
jgi:hypothetical protein